MPPASLAMTKTSPELSPNHLHDWLASLYPYPSNDHSAHGGRVDVTVAFPYAGMKSRPTRKSLWQAALPALSDISRLG